ncbi:MAG: CDP-alcohol phosphatidyltransferase family protein [Vicinamibacterales bacterium]
MIPSAASQFRCANVLTYLGVTSAAIAVAFTSGPETRFWGGAGIALAVALDLFDGRFARLFPRTADERRVGVEIDSLADVISFGLAPPVILLRVVPATTSIERTMLLAAAIIYLLCIVTRLAHFNIFQADTGGFIGLPSNMPPLVCAILLLWVPNPMVSALVLLLGGAAAVAGFRIPRPNRLTLYSILAISLAIGSGHVMALLRWW